MKRSLLACPDARWRNLNSLALVMSQNYEWVGWNVSCHCFVELKTVLLISDLLKYWVKLIPKATREKNGHAEYKCSTNISLLDNTRQSTGRTSGQLLPIVINMLSENTVLPVHSSEGLPPWSKDCGPHYSTVPGSNIITTSRRIQNEFIPC